jgi:hypothetical protein
VVSCRGAWKRPPRLVGTTPESRGATSGATALLRGIRIAAYLFSFWGPVAASGSSERRDVLFQGASPRFLFFRFLLGYGPTPRRSLQAALRVPWLRFSARRDYPYDHTSLGSKLSPATAHYPTSCYTFCCPLILVTPPRPRAISFRPVLFCPSLLSVGGVPISSGNENPSATNHGGCFAPSANHRRASVSRKGDAGPISPRSCWVALLTLAGALWPCHSFPGEQVASLHSPPPTHADAIQGGGERM